MRVPDEVFKSVVFLGHRLRMSTLEQQKLIGTGFIANAYEAGREYRYLVTARHAVLQLQAGNQEVRANSQSGGWTNIRLLTCRGHLFVPPELLRADERNAPGSCPCSS